MQHQQMHRWSWAKCNLYGNCCPIWSTGWFTDGYSSSLFYIKNFWYYRTTLYQEFVKADRPLAPPEERRERLHPCRGRRCQDRQTSLVKESSEPQRRAWESHIQQTFLDTGLIIIDILCKKSDLEWFPSTKNEVDTDPVLDGIEGARNSSSSGSPLGSLSFL